MNYPAALPGRLVFCAVAAMAAPLVFAQGPLTPPGAPAVSMKSLDQVEARTIVNAANTPGDANNTFIISQPGSYYLVGNLNVSTTKHGVSIEADNVTLDLNGFALISTAASGSGIGVNVPTGRVSLCVRNGTVRGWRSHGVGAINASSSTLERLRAVSNTGSGLQIGNESAVRDCVLVGNGTGLVTSDRVLVSGCVVDVSQFTGMAPSETTFW